MKTERLSHGFGPFFDEESEILVLGSFPSVKSREQQFYYGHPQNRFWKLMTIMFEHPEKVEEIRSGAGKKSTAAQKGTAEKKGAAGSSKGGIILPEDITVPQTREEKAAFARKHHIALWDVIDSCDIAGSADSTIKNAEVNDLSLIIPGTKIRKILVNGSTAWKLFEKNMAAQAEKFGIGIESCFKMPSTSSANATCTLPRLIEAWAAVVLQ